MTTTMTSGTAGTLEATGKVIEVKDGLVVFNPSGTRYQLYLTAPRYSGPIGRPLHAVITVKARKILTVPSGGNFIAPIIGPTRIIQGRVRALDEKSMVVQAGTPVVVEFPADDAAFDMARGPIRVGTIVNVLALPGARIEFR